MCPEGQVLGILAAILKFVLLTGGKEQLPLPGYSSQLIYSNGHASPRRGRTPSLKLTRH